ncbi:hypothetical protein Hanom_Chr03g00233521 [Helianthus anomalus]
MMERFMNPNPQLSLVPLGACLAKLFEKCLLTYWLFEKSVWSDFLEKSLFPLTYTLIAKHHFRAYDFSKSQ